MIEGEKDKGLNKLGLNGGSPNGHNWFVGEDGSALGDGPDVAGKFEVLQISQKFLTEIALGAQIGDVLFIKAQLLNVLYYLDQPGGNGKAAFVGDRAVKHVEIADAVL